MVLRIEFDRQLPIDNPDRDAVERALRRLRISGVSTFAILSDGTGAFVQVAGGGVGCVLERKAGPDSPILRAFLEKPIVSFADGTELSCSAGRIRLLQDEWVNIEHAIAVFVAFLAAEPFPKTLRWRDMTVRMVV